MIILRDYQKEAVGNIRKFFSKKGKSAIVTAPTGAGKTVIFSYIAQNTSAKGKTVLILTDRFELLTQTGGSIKEFGMNPYYIQAGTKYLNKDNNVYIAMAQTLRRRIENPLWSSWIKNNVDLIIIDEAHRQEFNYIHESGLLEDKFVLGFTATPQRSGQMRQLALDYEDIIETVTVKQLVEQGYLVSDDYYGVTGANLDNLSFNKMKGDFDEAEMFSRFNSPKLYAGVVKNWKEIVPHSKTLVFCVNIEHAIHTCEEFHENGIDARFIVSSMSEPKEPKKDETREGMWTRYEEKMRLFELYKESFGKWSGNRSVIISKFKKGEFPVLINASILTTGFDCPDIETVIVNRATTSVSLWYQMIGRGSRIAPKKTGFTVLDFGDNASRLGHYTMPMTWSLWHEAYDSGGGVPPVKECGIDNKGRTMTDEEGRTGCTRMIMASIKICPFCGFKYKKKKLKAADLGMVVFDSEKHEAILSKKINDMTDEELLQYHKLKKHQSAWLWRQLYYRGGTAKIEEFGYIQGWTNGTIQKAINFVSGL